MAAFTAIPKAPASEMIYTISKLARSCGLSRSTLLYYDKIGLLKPSGRTSSGYRSYTDQDRRRLERICEYRQAGLPLNDIQRMLSAPAKPRARIIDQRIREIGEQVKDLRIQRQLLLAMRKAADKIATPSSVDKQLWVEMLRAAGMDEQGMTRWHTEFEQRAPEAHHEFLQSLGIPDQEIHAIRAWSRKGRSMG